MVGHGAMTTVECRIETGDLRQIRKSFQQRADRRQVVGLVQGSQWLVAFQARQDRTIDQGWTIVFRPAVNDAVTDGNRTDLLRIPQPCARRPHRSCDIRNGAGIVNLVDQRFIMSADRAETGARADSLHLPLDQTFEVCGRLDREDLKLHARRAGVDDEDRVHGV